MQRTWRRQGATPRTCRDTLTTKKAALRTWKDTPRLCVDADRHPKHTHTRTHPDPEPANAKRRTKGRGRARANQDGVEGRGPQE
eukprot:1139883-Rhodomonas_salina.1